MSRYERGTVLEGSGLLHPPSPSLPNNSCRTLGGLGSLLSSLLAAL